MHNVSERRNTYKNFQNHYFKLLLHEEVRNMNNVRILLCCGAGMSSGFLAQRARQVAKKKKINATIDARSESDVNQYFSQIDILLVGPHYKAAMEGLKKECEPYGVPVVLIPQEVYATLDGEALIKLAMETLDKK